MPGQARRAPLCHRHHGGTARVRPAARFVRAVAVAEHANSADTGTFPLAAARVTLYITPTERSAGVAQG